MRAILFPPGAQLRKPFEAAAADAQAQADDRGLSETLDAFERTLITRALEDAGNNVAEAARSLRTDRANLYRRMKRLGLDQ